MVNTEYKRHWDKKDGVQLHNEMLYNIFMVVTKKLLLLTIREKTPYQIHKPREPRISCKKMFRYVVSMWWYCKSFLSRHDFQSMQYDIICTNNAQKGYQQNNNSKINGKYNKSLNKWNDQEEVLRKQAKTLRRRLTNWIVHDLRSKT